MDHFSRQAVAIAVDYSINGEVVVGVMERLADQGRAPRRIQLDTGSEFICKVFDKWAYWH